MVTKKENLTNVKRENHESAGVGCPSREVRLESKKEPHKCEYNVIKNGMLLV